MTLPPRVRIVEVGPRDGLQNEAAFLSVDAKVAFIEMLARAGLISIEAGSFVSPKAAPQMASTGEVLEKLRGRADLRVSVLVANPRGLEAAFKAGARELAVFAAASETFSRHNINCSIAESLARFKVMVEEAARRGIWARGYVSCALGCPYEGAVAPAQVAAVARELRAIGCAEVSLGDTIGVGTPLEDWRRWSRAKSDWSASPSISTTLMVRRSPIFSPVSKRASLSSIVPSRVSAAVLMLRAPAAMSRRKM